MIKEFNVNDIEKDSQIVIYGAGIFGEYTY